MREIIKSMELKQILLNPVKKRKIKMTHPKKTCKECKITKKNGETFVGSSYDCAKKLMANGAELKLYKGVNYGVWEAEDFCEKFEINAEQIKEDVGYYKVFGAFVI